MLNSLECLLQHYVMNSLFYIKIFVFIIVIVLLQMNKLIKKKKKSKKSDLWFLNLGVANKSQNLVAM